MTVSQPHHPDTSPPTQRAAATQWSLVFELGAGAAPAQEALAELCLRYGYPVYAYLRFCGRAPAAAAKTLHGFFHSLTDQSPEPADDAEGQRFRPFLIEQLQRYLAHPTPGDGRLPAASLAPEALEARFRLEPNPAQSPEAAFHRAFARELIRRAEQRLQHEAAQAGQQRLYQHLVPFLTRELEPGQYDALATALGSRPATLVTAVKRLRQRYRELVDAELATTVASAEDHERERHALRAALGG